MLLTIAYTIDSLYSFYMCVYICIDYNMKF